MHADSVDLWIHLQHAVTGYVSVVFIVCHFACMDRQCDKCDKWYHTKCVERHLRKKIERSEMKKRSYIGPCCSVNGDIIPC